MAVVQSKDADACIAALNSAGHVCTRFASFGGFLDKDNVTLMIGVDDAEVDTVIEILRGKAKQRSEILAAGVPAPVGIVVPPPPPLDVEVSGATVFVLDVARFEKL